MTGLRGKVAIVTGGAGGIGRASAKALAGAGAKVVVADVDEAGVRAVAESLRAEGAEAAAVVADVAVEEQVARIVSVAVESFGGVDILHNNAAATAPEHIMRDGAIHEMDAAVWDRTMSVNLRGYMLGVKHSVPQMLQRGGGVIINTASAAGLEAELLRSAYGASKAAVIGFTRSVATQYGKLGIRCVAIAAGLIMTPALAANLPPQLIEMMKRHFLTPRLGTPEDIADAVAFLASDRAGFITGVTIPIDGGFSVHTPSYADESAMLAAMMAAAPNHTTR